MTQILAHPELSPNGLKRALKLPMSSAPMAIKVAKNLALPKKKCQRSASANNAQQVRQSALLTLHFLNYVDGHLEPTLGLRKDIVRRFASANQIAWSANHQNEIGIASALATQII
jgi:hypothetical protein